MNVETFVPTVIEYFQNYSLKIVVAIAIFFAGKWLARRLANLAIKLMEKSDVDATLTKFLKNIIYYTLLVVVVMAVLDQVGINTTSFLAVMGAAGLAVGLALKDSLANFASGVMLILFRPFQVGDVVEAAGVTGNVEEITVFNTILKTPDNQKIIVPNSNITSNVITNVTAQETRRIDLVFGIGYGDDIGKAKELISNIIQADARIL
ncbi:MAG: mechanosensitive ion channel, partial [Pseudomonadota bacterium]|nr:mechanosensitive ion channel [Pseudomonadota bacterium]